MHIYLGKSYLVLSTEKTYALHINYRKLNLGHDGVDKEVQTDFCRSRSWSSVCVRHTGHDMFTRKYLPQFCAYSRDACLYTRVLLACGKYLYMHFTARA